MGISIWQLLIILAIVLVIFGAKRLKNVGADLGGAIKGFKEAVKEETKPEQAGDKPTQQLDSHSTHTPIDSTAQKKDTVN